MPAKNESEVLQHMALNFERDDGIMSGRQVAWVAAKIASLEFIYEELNRPEPYHPPLRFFDIGCGDLMSWEAWAPFLERNIEYVGIDGTQSVIDRARERHPDLSIYECRFSDLQIDTIECDVIVACDVLHHLPTQELYDYLMSVLFDGEQHRAVVLTHALTPSGGGGAKPGDPGFGWFARPFVVPDGWKVIHAHDEPTTNWALKVLVRTER